MGIIELPKTPDDDVWPSIIKNVEKILLPRDYQEGHSSLINYQQRDQTNSVLVSCAGHVTAFVTLEGPSAH
jgi:hypothetical protein